MLDLHCHILPGVDDGPADLDTAMRLATRLHEAGFSAVAASPHIGGGPGGDAAVDAAEQARQALTARLGEAGVPLEILPNAEHVITAELLERLRRGEGVTIGGAGRWLLVELPWGGIADPEGAFFRLQAKGYRLLWAHPERHDYIELPLVERLVARGIKVQLELGSFVDTYGARATQVARTIADRGLAHVLATDLHSPEAADAWLSSALGAVRQRYGAEALRRGASDSPRALVANAAIDDVPAFVEG
jgi:protein-tyrosine phosphatase